MVEMRARSIRFPEDLWETVNDKAAEADEKVSDFIRAALEAYTCTDCGDGTCEACGLAVITPEYADTEPMPSAAIMGFGQFSETTNPEVQAWIDRAKELLTEGAVGVSVSIDLNPDDLPDGVAIEDVTEEDIQNARLRLRHVAIVDTAAFSGAFLSIQADGTLAGPIVFEGENTGDLRSIELDQILLDETPLPIPILFDIGEGDHTGPVIGSIDRVERMDSAEPGDAPIAASASDYPAYLFGEPEPTPMTVHAPDAKGYRRYSGIIAPTNVCHKGRGGCYTYKGADLDYFHSGAKIPLDDGTFTRVGPLVFGGVHADDQKLDYTEALARTDDARRVFAMGRLFHHPKGLLFSGVLTEDADIIRIQATAPSVELWPNSRGKLEVKTALQVNVPAFPVAASVGSGLLVVTDEPVQVEGDTDPLIDLLERVEKLETAVGPLFAAHLSAVLE